jgi:hypothetical protein
MHPRPVITLFHAKPRSRLPLRLCLQAQHEIKRNIT